MRLVVSIVGALLALLTSLAPVGAQSSIVVINVHAWDCPPCIQWHNVHKKAWMNSREFKQVRYVEIDSPTIRQAYAAKYWPDDLQPILKQMSGHGVPRYLIVKDGKIVSDQYGVDHWAHTLADLGKLLPAVAAAPKGAPSSVAAGTYDGKWSVTQTCPDHKTAKGFTIRYSMVVADGVLRGQYGTEGAPDSMTLTGQIRADGTATLQASGFTGAAKNAVGNVQPGSSYDYPVIARFEATRGTGDRTAIRPCTFTFVRL